MRQYLVGALLAAQAAALLVPVVAMAQERGTLAEARAAEGALGLAAEAGSKVWLFTLGPAGGSSAGGQKVAEIGHSRL